MTLCAIYEVIFIWGNTSVAVTNVITHKVFKEER